MYKRGLVLPVVAEYSGKLENPALRAAYEEIYKRFHRLSVVIARPYGEEYRYSVNIQALKLAVIESDTEAMESLYPVIAPVLPLMVESFDNVCRLNARLTCSSDIVGFFCRSALSWAAQVSCEALKLQDE